MNILIGSARHDENGNLNGVKGDQLQTGINDTKGEVSMQAFYVHSKGWYILRPKNEADGHKIAERMLTACNNANIGYSQAQRSAIWTDGINSKKKTNTDCSALVRQCIKEAINKDLGNFTTANEKTVLVNSGLFTAITYKSGVALKVGDILVTKTKGHTAVVITAEEPKVSYYPKYNGTSGSITVALSAVGEKDYSLAHRKKIATANKISGYIGTATQNTTMLNLLKQGKLIKA